ALNKLHAISNVYTYLDAAHHGWIGWEDNFGATAQLMASTAKGTTAGVKSVDGFITNTANYSALDEPYIKVTSETRPSKWIDWNNYNDERTFSKAFKQKLISSGFDSKIGMLIDTSRNGWGGSDRPTKAATSGSLDEKIDKSRIDRRIHKGNWCNQSGAGIGERPKAAPTSDLDAYVWIKPPGESDGSSEEIPNDEGKGFDRMCDPTYEGNARNGNSMSGALDGAPISGAWFSAQFQQLLKNAYPAL
ncbi:MAG: glycoside hydrolase family 6 protein, partial [Micromonosporaceae bacterium]|nr:glycoside hydrolase family 6 protein [Micromonosporaceae bacterium]